MEAARKKPRIVILGGGFAGVYTAMALERALRGLDDFELVLVNKENYFVFQPMLPEVISGTIGLTDIVSPLRRLLPRTDLHIRDVEAIDLERQTVTTSPGFKPLSHELAYDHLVLALGTVTDFRGLRGLPEHARPFKNLGDALGLRNHVIRALEEASIERADARLRQELLTFVVAGGGFSGIEVVAELNDFVRDVAGTYGHIDPTELRVVLLHSQARILPEVAESLALFAQELLARRGVELRLGTRLEAATGTEAILANGERIPTRTLVSTVPSFPHPLIDALSLPKQNGRLLTDDQLRVQGAANVWAVGDCARILTPDDSQAPPTAQHATREAAVAAHNIIAALRGGEPRRFEFKGLGKMGSLGHRSAVAEIFGFQISGFVAWWIWRTIYVFKLPGWGRRLKVALSWTLDLILPPELIELRVGSSRGITREHYEPGQEVFKQGDLGDRLYIILSGEAEVVRFDEAGAETLLARLGAGQTFGEMALVRQSKRNASVRCTKTMDVLSLPKQEFAVLAANLPDLRKSFERLSDQRAADTGTGAQRAG